MNSHMNMLKHNI